MVSALATHPWAYPVLETLHLLGMGLLLGNLVLFECRVWGRHAALPPQALAQATLRLAMAGFVLSAATGALMAWSQWDEFSRNPAFLAKMGLLLAAGVNAVAFHSRRGVERMDRAAKAQTVLSLGIWLLVVACGRFIAYV